MSESCYLIMRIKTGVCLNLKNKKLFPQKLWLSDIKFYQIQQLHWPLTVRDLQREQINLLYIYVILYLLLSCIYKFDPISVSSRLVSCRKQTHPDKKHNFYSKGIYLQGWVCTSLFTQTAFVCIVTKHFKHESPKSKKTWSSGFSLFL